MSKRNRNVTSNVFDYPLSPVSQEESTVFTVATDIASIEPVNLLSAGCQDHKATETNSSADFSFVEKQEKALEFIRCHIAENRGKPQFNIKQTALEFGFARTTFTDWTNKAIKEWEQEHCCQPMGAAAWCISVSANISSYMGTLFTQTPKLAMQHEKVRPHFSRCLS